MEKYVWYFADGTSVEEDVDEEVFKILRQWDRKERYNKEKNIAMELFDDTADSFDVFEEIDKNAQEKRELTLLDLEKFGLDYSKTQLLRVLTEKQGMAYFYTRFVKLSNVKIGKIMGITEGAVRKLFKKAESNLQNHNMRDIEPDDAIKLIKAIFHPELL